MCPWPRAYARRMSRLRLGSTLRAPHVHARVHFSSEPHASCSKVACVADRAMALCCLARLLGVGRGG
eukprot:4398619-Prymnesium_polylepis.2